MNIVASRKNEMGLLFISQANEVAFKESVLMEYREEGSWKDCVRLLHDWSIYEGHENLWEIGDGTLFGYVYAELAEEYLHELPSDMLLDEYVDERVQDEYYELLRDLRQDVYSVMDFFNIFYLTDTDVELDDKTGEIVGSTMKAYNQPIQGVW